MKYLVLLFAFFVATANASVSTRPHSTPYEITDEDCDALNQVTRGIAMLRDAGKDIGVVKDTITNSPNKVRVGYVALTPKMLGIVDDVYSRGKRSKSPTDEGDEIYMQCMDHIYAGTAF